LDELRREAARERERGTRADRFRRRVERAPALLVAVGRLRFDEEELDAAPGRLRADEPGGEHPRVVHDEEIAGLEELGEIGDRAVGDPPGAVEDEQPRAVALRERVARDASRGELVGEVVEPHGAGDCATRSGGAQWPARSW